MTRPFSESEHIFSHSSSMPHCYILSDSDSRVNVEPSQNNCRFLDGFIMSSESCNLQIT